MQPINYSFSSILQHLKYCLFYAWYFSIVQISNCPYNFQCPFVHISYHNPFSYTSTLLFPGSPSLSVFFFSISVFFHHHPSLHLLHCSMLFLFPLVHISFTAFYHLYISLKFLWKHLSAFLFFYSITQFTFFLHSK